MADSRLAVAEKEHQCREAFGDFFPSLALRYTATADEYKKQILVTSVSGQTAGNNVQALSGIQPSRWIIRGDPPLNGLAPNYPYRIDPYRSFSASATVTQPLFTGWKAIEQLQILKAGS